MTASTSTTELDKERDWQHRIEMRNHIVKLNIKSDQVLCEKAIVHHYSSLNNELIRKNDELKEMYEEISDQLKNSNINIKDSIKTLPLVNDKDSIEFEYVNVNIKSTYFLFERLFLIIRGYLTTVWKPNCLLSAL